MANPYEKVNGPDELIEALKKINPEMKDDRAQAIKRADYLQNELMKLADEHDFAIASTVYLFEKTEDGDFVLPCLSRTREFIHLVPADVQMILDIHQAWTGGCGRGLSFFERSNSLVEIIASVVSIAMRQSEDHDMVYRDNLLKWIESLPDEPENKE